MDKSPYRLSYRDMHTSGTFQLDKMKSSDLGVFGKNSNRVSTGVSIIPQTPDCPGTFGS